MYAECIMPYYGFNVNFSLTIYLVMLVIFLQHLQEIQILKSEQRQLRALIASLKPLNAYQLE